METQLNIGVTIMEFIIKNWQLFSAVISFFVALVVQTKVLTVKMEAQKILFEEKAKHITDQLETKIADQNRLFQVQIENLCQHLAKSNGRINGLEDGRIQDLKDHKK